MFEAIQVEFVLFALMLTGVAVFHHRTFEVALVGGTIALVVFGGHVTVSYVVGFAVMLVLLGWYPHASHKDGVTGRGSPSWIGTKNPQGQ